MLKYDIQSLCCFERSCLSCLQTRKIEIAKNVNQGIKNVSQSLFSKCNSNCLACEITSKNCTSCDCDQVQHLAQELKYQQYKIKNQYLIAIETQLLYSLTFLMYSKNINDFCTYLQVEVIILFISYFLYILPKQNLNSLATCLH
ncbi:unnamed protein product [Paramecium octaurelia]|uniref:Transmembrane protein n=1 Tax=Paramecium octaurelia TaxID=43137 RepID=A0A8S1YPJ4_PAROT|nr:unnamed protein product [Paramecium octaurelia]